MEATGDEFIIGELRKAGAEWLMDPSDEHQQAEAIRRLVAATAAAERERLRAGFFKRFKGAGEHFFDYLHGDEEAERCVAEYWQEVLDELGPNTK